MYTLQEAEYLRDYYRDKIVGQKIGSGDTFRKLEIVCVNDKFQVWCYITSSAYAQLEKATQDLELISPEEVMKSREKKI